MMIRKPHLSRPWLLLARIALLSLSLLNLIIYIVGTPVYFAQIFPSNHDCIQECLTPADIQTLHTLGIPITAYAVYWVTITLLFVVMYFAVAALIFWRKSDDGMALLACFFLVSLGASFPDIPMVLAALHPAWQLPVTLVSEDVLGFPSLVFFFFLFPSGRFVPRWTRWMAIGFAVLIIPAGFSSSSPAPFLLLVPVVIIGSLVYGQVYRYRHVSTRIERQQTKWIVLGSAVALLGFLLVGVLLSAVVRLFTPLQSVGLLPSTILITSIYLLLLLIPLSIAIAILRYRLWDVDVIINKTLVYGLLTGILTVIYAGSIVGLQALFRGLFNQNSDVAIVVSTLFIYILFRPLRNRIQAVIDRRFFRRKYDAARTLAEFSAILRHEVDLATLSERLVAVVEETMQPAHISLWLSQPVKEPASISDGP